MTPRLEIAPPPAPTVAAPLPVRADVTAVRRRPAQAAWEAVAVRERLRILGRLRGLLVRHVDRLTAAIAVPERPDPVDTIGAEVLPLADAVAWLERCAPALLASRVRSAAGRPWWLGGVRLTIRRPAFGTVLIVGPANYPLLLPGVQAVQALAAGNAVRVKPGRDGTAIMTLLADLLRTAGLPEGLFEVLPEDVSAVHDAFADGIDLVVLTGSTDSGRAVLHLAAEHVVPAIVELSGCDAVFVLPGTDLDLLVRCLTFALRLNGGRTCLAPRRLFVPECLAADLMDRLRDALAATEPLTLSPPEVRKADPVIRGALAAGATVICGTWDDDPTAPRRPLVLTGLPPDAPLLRADLFVPVLSLLPFAAPEQALAADAACPYALGAAVFGPPVAATAFAARLRPGCVTINDLVAATADPRVPFGGGGAAGFGSTRGAEGLLALTRTQAVVEQTARWRPYLDPPSPGRSRKVAALLGALHADTWLERGRRWRKLIFGGKG